MSVITKQKADNLLGFPVEVKACDRQPGSPRHGNADMKFWLLALWILISGGPCRRCRNRFYQSGRHDAL